MLERWGKVGCLGHSYGESRCWTKTTPVVFMTSALYYSCNCGVELIQVSKSNQECDEVDLIAQSVEFLNSE